MIKQEESHSTVRRPGLFYGYIIVIASFFIFMMGLGSRNAFGVFFKPMANEFGWSSAAISSAFSLSMLLEGTMGIVMGRLTDKLGPRKVLLFCGVLMGAGYILISQVNALWQMYLFYGVVIGISMGGVVVPLISTTARWFNTRRTAMIGLILAGGNIGTLVASPAANWLIATYNWHTSYIIFGTTILIVVVSAACFLIRDPAQIGTVPYGENKAGEASIDLSSWDCSFNEAVHTRQFRLVLVGFLGIGLPVLAVTVHVVPYAIDIGISASAAANSIALIGGVNLIGRLVISAIAERIGNKRSYIIGFAVCLVSLLWLLFIKNEWGLYLFAAIFGFGQGAVGTIQGPMVAELFGLKSYGLIFGTCTFCSIAGGALGPILTGYIFDVTGNYPIALAVCVAVSIAGLISISSLTPVRGRGS